MGWGSCSGTGCGFRPCGVSGGRRVTQTPPSKHRSLSNLAPSERGTGHTSGVSPWVAMSTSAHARCTKTATKGLFSSRQLARALTLSRGPSPRACNSPHSGGRGMLSLSLPGHIPPDGWLCRSTKSASKARRDQINVELQALRSLLPISAREKERLSYLHTMALVCLRLRGAQLFPPGTHGAAVPHDGLALPGALLLPHRDSTSPCAPPADSAPPVGPALGTELLSLLPGFLLVLSANGKLVYISENVDQVLGLSMVRPVHQAFAVSVPVLVPLLHAWHDALANTGLWLQQAVHSGCQPMAHQGRDSMQWQPPLYQVELLAQGDTVFDILDGRTCEDVRKKLLLAQEQPGRGKEGLSWHLTDTAALPWPFGAAVREPGPAEQGSP